jgi:hypothetical protein
MSPNAMAGPPVAFLPWDTHRLPGRLGFAPAPGRWRLDSPLDLPMIADERGVSLI